MVYEKVGLANFFQYIIIIILFIIFLFYIMKSSPSPPPLQGIGALLRALPVTKTIHCFLKYELQAEELQGLSVRSTRYQFPQ